MSRQVRPLIPEDGKTLRMYCCGPTVYGPSHIGNFRTFVMEDVLRRVVEIAGLQVLHVRNITDVDDKTIRDAQREGVPLQQLTDHWIEMFRIDCAKLNMLTPHFEPRATEHIERQIELIATLLEKGHAYRGRDGSIYFRIETKPDYGRLTRIDTSTLETQDLTSGGTANLADEYERDAVADFALWKIWKPEHGPVSWPSPWGDGHPGWHIECSAMSMQYLGETLDLHCGAVDNMFPHHENEIAQSEAVTGHEFSRHWFHGEHLIVEGKKMSKSMGNFFTLDEILERGVSPMAFRYTLISGHYRQQFNFTFNGLRAAQSALDKLERSVRNLQRTAGISMQEFAALSEPPFTVEGTRMQLAWAALCHDLNTPDCMGKVFSALRVLESEPIDAGAARMELEGLAAIMYALGLSFPDGNQAESELKVPREIAKIAGRRSEARKDKDWALADQLREELAAKGWRIKDRREGYDLEVLS